MGLPQIIMANVLESLTNVLRTLANHSEKQNQAYPKIIHDINHGVETIFTTDLTDLTDRVLQGVRQKPEKPLALYAKCLLRAIDAVPV